LSTKIKDKRKLKQKLKRLAPKIPDYTCPDIDYVIGKLDEFKNEKKYPSNTNLRVLKRKLERLRSHNEALRSSGHYWYDKMCAYVFEE